MRYHRAYSLALTDPTGYLSIDTYLFPWPVLVFPHICLPPLFDHLSATVDMASQAEIAQIMLLVESGIPLTEIPAGRPPTGQVSHLHHAVGRTHMITTCDGICITIVTIVVAMRMYTRIRLLKSLWWDDCKSLLTILRGTKADRELRVYIVRSRMLARRNRIVPICLQVWSRQAHLRPECRGPLS
jgi:hypothetical protein